MSVISPLTSEHFSCLLSTKGWGRSKNGSCPKRGGWRLGFISTKHDFLFYAVSESIKDRSIVLVGCLICPRVFYWSFLSTVHIFFNLTELPVDMSAFRTHCRNQFVCSAHLDKTSHKMSATAYPTLSPYFRWFYRLVFSITADVLSSF